MQSIFLAVIGVIGAGIAACIAASLIVSPILSVENMLGIAFSAFFFNFCFAPYNIKDLRAMIFVGYQCVILMLLISTKSSDILIFGIPSWVYFITDYVIAAVLGIFALKWIIKLVLLHKMSEFHSR